MTIAEKLQKIYDNTPVVYEKGNLDTLDKVYNRSFTNEDIKFPEDTTSIGNYAYAGCENLTSITLPEQIKSIGEKAFLDCINLRTIDCAWKRDTIPGAPWGATNAEIKYKAGTIQNALATITFKNVSSQGVGLREILENELFSGFKVQLSTTWQGQGKIHYTFEIILPNDYSYYSTFEVLSRWAGSTTCPIQHPYSNTIGYYANVEKIYAVVPSSLSKEDIIEIFGKDSIAGQILSKSLSSFYIDDHPATIDLTSDYRIGSTYYLEYNHYEHIATYNISLSNLPSDTKTIKLIDNDSGNEIEYITNGQTSFEEDFIITSETKMNNFLEVKANALISKEHDNNFNNQLLKFVYYSFSSETIDFTGFTTDIWATETQFTVEA